MGIWQATAMHWRKAGYIEVKKKEFVGKKPKTSLSCYTKWKASFYGTFECTGKNYWAIVLYFLKINFELQSTLYCKIK